MSSHIDSYLQSPTGKLHTRNRKGKTDSAIFIWSVMVLSKMKAAGPWVFLHLPLSRALGLSLKFIRRFHQIVHGAWTQYFFGNLSQIPQSLVGIGHHMKCWQNLFTSVRRYLPWLTKRYFKSGAAAKEKLLPCVPATVREVAVCQYLKGSKARWPKSPVSKSKEIPCLCCADIWFRQHFPLTISFHGCWAARTII